MTVAEHKYLTRIGSLTLVSLPALVISVSLVAVILASCVIADIPNQELAVDPGSFTATETLLPTNSMPSRTPRPPIATAAPFTLFPSNTSIPTFTPIPGELLPGYGFGPIRFPLNVNPLTGLQVIEDDVLQRRPMVIKITNFPRSVRPQWGLSLADHVYEYYLEDELTRFIGVYYGRDASRVGPIRSARPFDEHIVRAYKGIFAFGYADDRVIDLWKDSDLKNFLVIERPGNCPPMCRIGSKSDYNTLYTDTHLLSQYITERGTNNDRQNLDGLRFEEYNLMISGGGQATYIETRFSPSSYNYWKYDPVGKRYLRWQETERATEGNETCQPLLDSLTGEQVAADNLIILFVPTSIFFQSSSTVIYDFKLLDGGDGYAMRNGKIFKILYYRPARESMPLLVWPDGTPYTLKPGNVWFEVLSNISTHKVKGQSWTFSFVLPVTP